MSRLVRTVGLSATLGCLALAGACAVEPSGSQAPQAESLLDVQIAEDFTFATSRGLAVRAEGDPARVAETLAEVRLPDGQLVHRGSLASAVELAVPTWAESLEVTLRSGSGEQVTEIRISGGEAVVSVQ